jgi:hypothetical protein
MTSPRRFPPPWSIDESSACYIVGERQAGAGACLFRERARPALKCEAAHPRIAVRSRFFGRGAIAGFVFQVTVLWVGPGHIAIADGRGWAMKKILMIIALAGALVAGAVVMFHPHQALACEGSNCPWAPSL